MLMFITESRGKRKQLNEKRVFSFKDYKILASKKQDAGTPMGVSRTPSYCLEVPQNNEFGLVGANRG